MDFRFVHCADVHLGGRFAGLAQRSEDAAEILSRAAEQALDQMATMAIEEGAAFVVVSGDLYDGQWTDVGVGFAAARAFGRLHQAGIRSFLVKGNHDAESVVTNAARLPESVHVFGSDSPECVEIADLGVAVHGWSFRDRAAPDNMALRYPAARPGLVNIGVLHTSLDGRPGHAPYAPCSIDDLTKAGYDYWALGHVHEREIVRSGATGGAWIVFPGSLQGRSPREPGARGAMVVDVRGGRVSEARFRPCDVARFATCEVSLTGVEDAEAIEAVAREALVRAVDSADGRPVVARVRFEGETPLDPVLRAESRTLMLQRMNDTAFQISDQLWIEKVKVETRPLAGTEAVGVDPEFEAILDELVQDDEIADRVREEIEQLRRRAPFPLEIESDAGEWLRRARAALAATSA